MLRPMRITKAIKRAVAAEFGKAGGKARAKKLTPHERTLAARKAANARWAKRPPRTEQAE